MGKGRTLVMPGNRKGVASCSGFLSLLTSGVDGEAERGALNPGEGEGDSLGVVEGVETGGH